MTTGRHVVAGAAGQEHVQVTASLEQAGLLGPLVGVLTRQLTNRYLEMEVRGLKARCEK